MPRRPASKRTYKKKSSAPRRRNYRRRNPLPRAPTGTFGSRVETFSKTGTMGQVYDLNNISLANLPICAKEASLFQYYRITSVQMRFKPNFDTFTSSGGSVLPYLYFLYDKAGSLGALDADQFEQAGAKPVRFDEKTIIRKWRPAVITGTIADAITQFKTSPWLPTHDLSGASLNDVLHTGAVWYISKMNPGDATTYDIDITVTVQFRKALVEPTAGAKSTPLLSV